MTRLPVVSAKKAIAALKRGGFEVERVRGSHYRLSHPNDPQRQVTVPMHGKDLSPMVLRSILKQAGLTIEQFVALL
jgi:predicted RNA binding protein YcfA (HicA-like mRNA interferase family)